MLLDAGLPFSFWAEAIKTPVYIHCRTPNLSLPDIKTPYEMLYRAEPAFNHLRRFGYTIYRHLPKEQHVGKFESRARPCTMLGFVHGQQRFTESGNYQAMAVHLSARISDSGRTKMPTQQAIAQRMLIWRYFHHHKDEKNS
jgi:hypothetical protein